MIVDERMMELDDEWERYAGELFATGMFPHWHIECSHLTFYAGAAVMLRMFLTPEPGVVATHEELLALARHIDMVVRTRKQSDGVPKDFA